MKSILSENLSLTKNRTILRKPQDNLEKAQLTREEHMEVEIYQTMEDGSIAVAKEIAQLIKEKQKNGQTCVLGLAAGISPIKLYQELIKIHKEEKLSFANVVVFNLNEYYLKNKKNSWSYAKYMQETFFDHVDIKPENIHTPKGNANTERLKESCQNYERKIEEHGGIDLQILGIGRSGRIGFNEPGSHASSHTRIIALEESTIRDSAKEFGDINQVPQRALTMGVATILKAKKIILLAWGRKKAKVIRKAVEGNITEEVPASFLQGHQNTQVIIDLDAANELTRVKTPWKVSPCDWTPSLVKRAVVHLCKETGKPILKLTEKDYNNHSLGELVISHESAYNVNLQVFNEMSNTITGWPGGKPNADDTKRPERKTPVRKRVLVFSPHPDDDVISMGGTLRKLVEQNHEVYIAYQVSGNIAVADYELLRTLSFVKGFLELNHKENSQEYQHLASIISGADNEIFKEKTTEILKLKGLLRKEEALSSCRYLGVNPDNIFFLNLPFYETGTIKKDKLGEKDVSIVKELLEKIQPHQIFAIGDLMDPHDTHISCLGAILLALDKLKKERKDWLANCWVWLYRGTWQEWPVNEIEMAVPMTPSELRLKRNAILRHQSQMESAPFMGGDSRLFWQRAEDRNRKTAEYYNQLGLPEYEAIEGFVRYVP